VNFGFYCYLQVRYLVDHIRLEELNESNLQSALCAALLLLPSEFSEVR
jgi:hypothetical protein